MLISSNDFIENKVIKEDRSWRFSDAGAIYYSCHPTYDEEKGCNVVLKDNKFIGNTAENKGGAMRWVNKNFTYDEVELFAPWFDHELWAEEFEDRNFEQRRLQAGAEEDNNQYVDNSVHL